jgi:hypothetical protein
MQKKKKQVVKPPRGIAPREQKQQLPPIHELHMMCKEFRAKELDTFDLCKVYDATVGAKDQKESKVEAPSEALAMLKGIVFKRDKPYRCILGVHNNVSTNASGVLNSQFTVLSLSTVVEWTTISALFDEVFVHSMRVKYFPVNITGVGPQAATGIPTVTQAAGAQAIQNCGAIICAFFSNAGLLTSAAALVANPNHKTVHTAKTWQYTWRNNVRFDPHGIAMDPLTGIAWNGWTFVTAVGEMGGSIQLRAVNDPTLAISAVLGTFQLEFDCSFRSRI